MRVIKFGTVVFLPTDTRPADTLDDVLKKPQTWRECCRYNLVATALFSEGDKKNSSKRPKECDKQMPKMILFLVVNVQCSTG